MTASSRLGATVYGVNARARERTTSPRNKRLLNNNAGKLGGTIASERQEVGVLKAYCVGYGMLEKGGQVLMRSA